MAGKNLKNPLLTSANLNFPFENFNSGNVLVPVPENEPPLVQEEIEADSFLGQEPKSTSGTLKTSATFKIKNSLSNQSLSSDYSEPSLGSDLRLESQLQIPSSSPIPVFTQSFTGAHNPTKPTPVYGDALAHRFSQNSNLHTNHALDPNNLSQPSNQTDQLLEHQPFYSNQSFTYINAPSFFPSAPTPASNISNSSVYSTQRSTPEALSISSTQGLFNCITSSQQLNTTTSIPGAPPATASVTLVSTTTSPGLTQQPPINTPPPAGSKVNSYRLSNIKRPTYSRPPDLPVAPIATMPLAPMANIPSPMTSPPMSAALFTPCAVDSLGAERTSSPPSTPLSLLSSPASYKFSGQSLPASKPTILPPSFANLAQGTSYRPVYHHWFFKKVIEGKAIWQPFSMTDSLALEQAFTSPTILPETKVPTDGGRYDVEVLRRRRTAVYWAQEPAEVRRCSWFVKGSLDVRYVPFEENIATLLEEEYRIACTSSEWNRQVALPDGEMIVIHSPHAIAHHTRSSSPDVWGNSPQMQQKPRVVKRGMDEFDISDGEPEHIDHLLFLVHGIGKFCDLKFRLVNEVVDDFRSISLQLVQSHFKEAVESGIIGRIEVLPVSWHQALHSEHIDQRLNNITLQSIPRLRNFTNDTLLDILFYTSPVFCETIVQAVGNELNRLYNLFLSRNPSFQGGVSLGGHSLGSLILFDMLCNQTPSPASDITTPSSPVPEEQEASEKEEEVSTLGCKGQLSRTVSYVTMGKAGTGLPFISYPQLVFRPKAFFALGSPIGMFVTVRGIASLGEDFFLPTCPTFFNIFHPFDPVAYRIESLINPEFSKYSPVLIPHHKGRKRMHLELKDTLEHVGTALKQKLVESVRNTWNTVYQLAMFHRSQDADIEQEVNKVIENELRQSHACQRSSEADGRAADQVSSPEPDVRMGQLNGGRRVDYVLQEAPLESFNEYLFALSSHVCYWESEDTLLMILKEIYSTMGITPDSQVVQQILPFEIPDGREPLPPQYVSLPSLPTEGGMDPTAPITDHTAVGPPPKAGFMRK